MRSSSYHIDRDVWIVEDDPDDQELIRDAWAGVRPDRVLRFFSTADDLLRHAATGGDRPGLILLDLNLPGALDGRQLLDLRRGDATLRPVPVIVFTTSEAEADVTRSYDAAASSYIVKPSSYVELEQAIRDLEHYWFELVRLPTP